MMEQVVYQYLSQNVAGTSSCWIQILNIKKLSWIICLWIQTGLLKMDFLLTLHPHIVHLPSGECYHIVPLHLSPQSLHLLAALTVNLVHIYVSKSLVCLVNMFYETFLKYWYVVSHILQYFLTMFQNSLLGHELEVLFHVHNFCVL